MGRRERDLDPNAGPVEAFAVALRQARAQVGNPPYKQLARTAGFSASALSQAASGYRLPSWPLAQAYLRACGVRDSAELAEWEHRWRTVRLRESQQTAADGGEPGPGGPDTPDAPLNGSGAAFTEPSAPQDAEPGDARPEEPRAAADADRAAGVDVEAAGVRVEPLRGGRPRRTVMLAAASAVALVIGVVGWLGYAATRPAAGPRADGADNASGTTGAGWSGPSAVRISPSPVGEAPVPRRTSPADPVGEVCRTPAHRASRAPVYLRPCVAVADGGLETSVHLRAVAPAPDVLTVHVWLVDAQGGRLPDTLRACEVTFAAADETARCGPFPVRPEQTGRYGTASAVQVGAAQLPVEWRDPGATGTQSGGIDWSG